MIDPEPLFLSFKLAVVTTVFLLIIGLPLAWMLSAGKHRAWGLLEVILGMPIVLPPTVLGFYLLIAFGSGSAIGRFLESAVGLELAFSFPGLVVASIIYSLPFMIYPVTTGLRGLSRNMIDSARVLGKPEWSIFTRIMLPNIRHIPGETRVASIAVYEQVELLNYHDAHWYSLILVLSTFLILGLLFMLNKRSVHAGG